MYQFKDHPQILGGQSIDFCIYGLGNNAHRNYNISLCHTDFATQSEFFTGKELRV